MVQLLAPDSLSHIPWASDFWSQFEKGCLVPGLHPPCDDFGSSVCAISRGCGIPAFVVHVFFVVSFVVDSREYFHHAIHDEKGRNDFSPNRVEFGISVFSKK